MADKPQNFDELSELLSAFLDGELSEADCARVEAELLHNTQFRQLRDELRGLQAGITLLPRHAAPRGLAAGVLERIAATSADNGGSASAVAALPTSNLSPNKTGSAGWLAWAPALAVAALVLVAVGIFYQPAGRDVAEHAPAFDKAATVGDDVPADSTSDEIGTDVAPSTLSTEMKAKSAVDAGGGFDDRRRFGKGGGMGGGGVPISKSAALPRGADNKSKLNGSLEASDRKQFESINAPMLQEAPSQLARPAAAPLPEAANRISGQSGMNSFPFDAQRFSQIAGEGQGGRFNARSVTRDEWAAQLQVAEVMDDELDDDVLVIACDVTPQALEAKTLDQLLSAQQIAVYDVPDEVVAQQSRRGRLGLKPDAAAVPPEAKAELRSSKESLQKAGAKPAETGPPAFAADEAAEKRSADAATTDGFTAGEESDAADVAQGGFDRDDLPAADEAVLVEATAEQIAALLDELEQRPAEFSQVAVLAPPPEQVAKRQQNQRGQRGAAGDANRQRRLQNFDRVATGRANTSSPREEVTRNALPQDESVFPSQSQAYRIQLAPREGQTRGLSRYANEQRQATDQPARAAQATIPPAPATQQAELPAAENGVTEHAKDARAADEIAPPGNSRVLLLLRAVPSEAADR